MINHIRVLLADDKFLIGCLLGLITTILIVGNTNVMDYLPKKENIIKIEEIK